MNVGIIGLGVGEKHLDTFQSHSDIKSIKICDFDSNKLSEVMSKNSISQGCSNPKEILEDPSIDLVSICSYDNFHTQQIVSALKNKKHVFVEKPICLSSNELDEIKQAFLESSGLKLSSNFILRKEPRFIELRDKISNGDLGEIYYAEGSYDYGRLNKITNGWRGQIKHYSVMHGGGIHLLDLLMWVCNTKFLNSTGLASKIQTMDIPFSGPEFCTSLLEMENGIAMKLSANFGSNTPHFHQIKVYGTKGTFIHDCNDAKYFFNKEPNVTQVNVNGNFPGAQKGDLLTDFIDSVINDSHYDLNADKVFEVMNSSVTIEKNLRIINAISK